jgi:hypothetical protein
MSQHINPWSPDDEKEHYPSVLEWWCTEGFINDEAKEKTWCFKGSFSEWCTKDKKHGSTFDFTLFDPDTKKHFSSYIRNDKNKLDIKYEKQDKICIRFDKSFLSGSYPSYNVRFENIKDQIILELDYNTKALPHWITQEITGGYLPMGFGFYRYGFIPRNTIQGTLQLQDKSITVHGTGYYEHVWGDFSYKNPLSDLSYLIKSISIYQKLVAWWIYHHQPKIPNKLKFYSENNPLGYDWIWGILDNGWSFFLGNILFWVAEGPMFGTLILTKDGKKYQEFCDVCFKYKNLEPSKHFDFVYPTCIEIIAKHNQEILTLNCEMTMPCREFITPLYQKNWIAFVICEAPGKVSGVYTSDSEHITLNGKCKIEPQRQVSVRGHNELLIDIIKPPEGVGINIELASNFLKKQIKASLIFQPRPQWLLKIKKIKR